MQGFGGIATGLAGLYGSTASANPYASNPYLNNPIAMGIDQSGMY